MELPDGRPLILNADVLGESSGDRLILWLPEGHDGGGRWWERIGTVAKAQLSLGGHLFGCCHIGPGAASSGGFFANSFET